MRGRGAGQARGCPQHQGRQQVQDGRYPPQVELWLELFRAKGSFIGQVCAAADLQDDLRDGHEQGAGGPGGPGPQAAAAGHRDGAQVRGGGDDQPGQYYYSHL